MAKPKVRVLSDGTYSVIVRSRTGFLIVGVTKWRMLTASREQPVRAYYGIQRHNFVLGWWGWYGWIFNSLSIRHNHKARRESRRLVVSNVS